MKNVPNGCFELLIDAIHSYDIDACRRMMEYVKPRSRFAYSAYLCAIKYDFTTYCMEFVHTVELYKELEDKSCFLDYVCPDDDLYDFLVKHGACHSSEHILLGEINSQL